MSPNRDVTTIQELALKVLEKANERYSRAARIGEIVEQLSANERLMFEETYSKPLATALAVVIELLECRNLTFVKRAGRTKFYGSRRVLDAANWVPPEIPDSRRRTSLRLVVEATLELQQPVRAGDVIRYAERIGVKVQPKLIVRDLNGLIQTGELVRVKKLRGDAGGLNLYLPAHFDQAVWRADVAQLTWLEYVKKHFCDLWEEHVRDAGNLPPYAITTSEVNERLRSQEPKHPRLVNPIAATNALKRLSAGMPHSNYGVWANVAVPKRG